MTLPEFLESHGCKHSVEEFIGFFVDGDGKEEHSRRKLQNWVSTKPITLGVMVRGFNRENKKRAKR